MSYVRHRAEREAVGILWWMLCAIFIIGAVAIVIGVILAVALAFWLVGLAFFLVGKATEALTSGEQGATTIERGKSIASMPLRFVGVARTKLPAGRATVVQPPPPALPAPKEYSVVCPSCSTPLTSKAGENIACPACKARMDIAAP